MICNKQDELLELFREYRVHPNVIFQFPDGEKKETYFDEDTPIDVIKAYVSSESHSKKDVKMSILKKAAEFQSSSKKFDNQSLPPLDNRIQNSNPKKTANDEKISKKTTNENQLPPLNKNANKKSGQQKKEIHTKKSCFKPTKIQCVNGNFTPKPNSRLKSISNRLNNDSIQITEATNTHSFEVLKIELETIRTFNDILESNYRYEECDVIRVDYEKGEKVTKVTYPSLPSFQENVEFVPFHVKKEVPFLMLGTEFVHSKFLSEEGSMIKTSVLRRKLKPVIDESGNLVTPITKELTAIKQPRPRKKTSKISRFMPEIQMLDKPVVSSSSKDEEECDTLFTILFSENGKVLHNFCDGEKCILDFFTKKVFVFYVEKDVIDIEEQLLTIEPECVRLAEKPKVSVNSLKIVDYNEKSFVTEVVFNGKEFENASVKSVIKKVAKNVGKDENDISLLAEYNDEDVLLFDKEELLSSVLTKTKQQALMLLEITDKKKAPPRMIKNLKKLASDRLSESDINDIYIYSGRSSDISISTIHYYS